MINKFKFNKVEQLNSKKINKKQASRKVAREPVNIEWRNPGVIIFSLVVLVVVLAYVSPKEDLLPIEKIRVSGDFNHLDTSRLEAQLQPFLGRGFFSVDIQEIQQILGQQAWISNVSVRRLWPNQLKVSIIEKQAYARWDEKHLLSKTAKIFEADSDSFQQLPVIHGYMGQSAELLSRFNELQLKFNKYDLEISELREDNKGALSLKLKNKLLISLGSEHNELKIKNFLAVYKQQIKPRIEHIKHIDFRYSNGFSIAWEKGYLKNMGKLEKRGNRNV